MAHSGSELAGRTALVTGGSGGIGAAVTRALRARGARVASLDLLEASDCELAISGDVSRSADVDAAVARVASELGGPDVLVCAAGILGRLCTPLELSDEDWNRVLAVNAGGVFYSMRAALPGMVARGYGRVVNLASIAAKEGLPDGDAYAASKAAVVSLTRTVARSVAGTGVLVNCVAPTIVTTPMLDALSPSHRASALARIPLGRFAEPGELAEFIVYLASERLSFQTGMCFDFSGGRANW